MKRHALCKWTPVIAEIFNFVDPSPYALYFWIELATYILLDHTRAVLANPKVPWTLGHCILLPLHVPETVPLFWFLIQLSFVLLFSFTN